MAFDTGFSKSIFQSTTFWGAVMTALAMSFPTIFTKLNITTANTATIAQYIVQAIGFVITVYGRFTAKQVVTLTGGPMPPAVPASGSKG